MRAVEHAHAARHVAAVSVPEEPARSASSNAGSTSAHVRFHRFNRGSSTGRTDLNGATYDAHIHAVKLQAKMARQPERDMFHQLRWGRGELALAPPPPELESDR